MTIELFFWGELVRDCCRDDFVSFLIWYLVPCLLLVTCPMTLALVSWIRTRFAWSGLASLSGTKSDGYSAMFAKSFGSFFRNLDPVEGLAYL